MRFLAILFSLGLAGLFSPNASAYEPESGMWWNPQESGTGYNIEIQDDMMAVAIYGGAANGYAKWYTAVGRLDGNALFEADLLSFRNVQPMGQPYTGRPTLEPGYGTLTIVFDPDDNRRAMLTWPNGRTIPIERHEFYFVRPEDSAGVRSDTLRMLGEWQITIDQSTNLSAPYPFSADVLVFDDYDYDSYDGLWYFEGCRPDNAQVGGCSEFALTNHDAVGYFESPTGWHVSLVKDGVFNGRLWWALYVMRMGTNDGSGEFTLYPDGADPEDWSVYAVRAFRSASRTFVQEGVGPAKHAGEAGRSGGLAAQFAAHGALSPIRKDAKDVVVQSRFDRTALLPQIRALEAKLQQSR